MVRLTIGNSICKLEGLSPATEKEIRNLLSYIEPGGHFARRGPQRRCLMGKDGTFPTGLTYLVHRGLAKEVYEIIDNRKVPESSNGLFTLRQGVAPYPEQLLAATACFARSRGIVVAPTGVGKSMIAALIINALQVRTLVVVPSLELKRQLTESLGYMFGKASVGGLRMKRPIVVENVDALDPSEGLKGYDCVIIDEFHHSGASTYRKLNKKAWINVYYKFGLTATPFRSQDEEKLLLESVLSEVIYRVGYQDAVSKGYIVPMEAYYIELPKRHVEGYTWAEVYKELVTDNKERNRLILSLMTRLNNANASTLCLVKEIAHGERLCGTFPFANGTKDDTAGLISEFNRGESVLVATAGVCGEGVDTKPCEYVILAGLGKSRNAFMQQVGRGFRRYADKTSCKVILIKDPSHKFTKSHFAAQVKILKEEYGIVPVKLDYSSLI